MCACPPRRPRRPATARWHRSSCPPCAACHASSPGSPRTACAAPRCVLMPYCTLRYVGVRRMSSCARPAPLPRLQLFCLLTSMGKLFFLLRSPPPPPPLYGAGDKRPPRERGADAGRIGSGRFFRPGTWMDNNVMRYKYIITLCVSYHVLYINYTAKKLNDFIRRMIFLP